MNIEAKPSSKQYNVALESYQKWLSQQNVTSNTLRVYHSRIKRFLLFMEYSNLGDKPHHEAMQLYISFLKNSKTPSSTINANLNALRNFSHFLGFKDTKFKREKCSYKSGKALTTDEQNEFLISVERQKFVRDKALALMLFYDGIRMGDCARLNMQDVIIDQEQSNQANQDDQRKTISICFSNGTKVQLNESTATALNQWLEERKSYSSSEQSLWLTNSGKRLTISGITFVIRRIGWQARMMLSPEILRRTWLSNVTVSFNKNGLASKFGNYISLATVNRLGALYLPEDISTITG